MFRANRDLDPVEAQPYNIMPRNQVLPGRRVERRLEIQPGPGRGDSLGTAEVTGTDDTERADRRHDDQPALVVGLRYDRAYGRKPGSTAIVARCCGVRTRWESSGVPSMR